MLIRVLILTPSEISTKKKLANYYNKELYIIYMNKTHVINLKSYTSKIPTCTLKLSHLKKKTEQNKSYLNFGFNY